MKSELEVARKWLVCEQDWTCSSAFSTTSKSFASEVFPWNLPLLSTKSCRAISCLFSRIGSYLISCSNSGFFLFLKILFYLLAIICCFQTGFVKPWYHWGVIGRTALEVLPTRLQSITLTKQDFFSPCSAYQQGFCSVTLCVGEESRHCCITHWPE